MDDLVTWPACLPLPQQDGYGYQPPDLVARTDNDAGVQRARRRFTSGVTMFDFKLRLGSLQQLAIWDAFVKLDLLDGIKWFSLDLEEGGDIAPHACQLASQPKRAKVAPTVYDISLTVRAEPCATAMTAEEYAAIRDLAAVDIEGLDAWTDQLHHIMHETLPSRAEWEG